MGLLSEQDSVCIYAAYKERGLWSTLTLKAQTPAEKSQELPCPTLQLDYEWPTPTRWQVLWPQRTTSLWGNSKVLCGLLIHYNCFITASFSPFFFRDRPHSRYMIETKQGEVFSRINNNKKNPKNTKREREIQFRKYQCISYYSLFHYLSTSEFNKHL